MPQGADVMSVAGRACPLRYRYGAQTLAELPEHDADTLYVVGGLYGNRFALDALDALLADESEPAAVVFNGDFHWFDVDDTTFTEVDRRVALHHAILGNVEAELGEGGDEAGCGCAYPEYFDAGTVARSNRIHSRLKVTAARHPNVLARFAALPMAMRWRVGNLTVGILHGDADSLAGWRFDPAALDEPANRAWVETCFAHARVDVFASSHTCTAGLRAFPEGTIINNGAAGIGNAPSDPRGRITRISVCPSPHDTLEGKVCHRTYVDAVPLDFDARDWQQAFLANWPPGSDAHV